MHQTVGRGDTFDEGQRVESFRMNTAPRAPMLGGVGIDYPLRECMHAVTGSWTHGNLPVSWKCAIGDESYRVGDKGTVEYVKQRSIVRHSGQSWVRGLEARGDVEEGMAHRRQRNPPVEMRVAAQAYAREVPLVTRSS
jgi:hypothetical protein